MVAHVLCHLCHVCRHRRHGGYGVWRQLRCARLMMREVLYHKIVGAVVKRVLRSLRMSDGVIDAAHVSLGRTRLTARLWHPRLGQHRL